MADQEKKDAQEEPPLSASNHNNRREEWFGEMADDPKLLNDRYKEK